MQNPASTDRCASRFTEHFGVAPQIVASAPGRLEVLGNHTDYNGGLTLSCAVGLRCFAGLAPLDRPEVRLASTAFAGAAQANALDTLAKTDSSWADYILGLVTSLQQIGVSVPGFVMLIDSAVPVSAGMSSSSAMEMAALFALAQWQELELTPLEMAKIGQHTESAIVGARTGLLDPLTALLGEPDHLLGIDFQSMDMEQHAMPPGWCFVVVDSGVKHDLTQQYNQRRASCEAVASAMGVASLREINLEGLLAYRSVLSEEVRQCAGHVITENDRVRQSMADLRQGNIEALGQFMFQSHASSQVHFQNSCDELDAIVDLASRDPRCAGARLSGGGFGGITIHLVKEADADHYLIEMLGRIKQATGQERWGAVCRIDAGARLEERL